MKTVDLHKGDGLRILPETDEFRFGCCKCGVIHLIKVKREKKGILLQFFRDKESEKKIRDNKGGHNGK